ncbi:MAG: peptide chain release factor N(5)-glutamine methyltransferase [Myxococcales bacterium]|nr:peptide chain release factor N(5)-glutamine methyltransferase [Myxococcales bacterium]
MLDGFSTDALVATARMPERNRPWTLMEVLDWTRQHFERKSIDTPRLDAEVLLSEVLQLPRVMLYARFDQPLHNEELARMRGMVAQRAAGVPIARLLGRREFWSLELDLTPDVLVPRPESELLIEICSHRKPSPQEHLVDVGTGSGALALALATEYPASKVWALEYSQAAITVAKNNTAKHELAPRVCVVESDLLAGLPPQAQPVDIMVANLPYIPTDEIPHLDINVRDHDPHLALNGGKDGLDLIRRLILDARHVLKNPGLLALESSSDQTEDIAELMGEAGYTEIQIDHDLAGLPRVTSGLFPADKSGKDRL